jgi:Arc/MetJ family transcription regulator
MRTNIEIDDKLMKQAMKSTGSKTKREAVDFSLRLAIRLKKQSEALEKLWGIGWDGDLDEIRQGREFGQS